MVDFSNMDQLYILRDFRSKRSSSWDRTGGNTDWITLKPGEDYPLLEEKGAGCIKHIYWTYIYREEPLRLNVFRGLVLRMFWNDESNPSVEAPLGDFFGVANGQVRPIRSLAFTVNPGFFTVANFSWGFNCYLPMPFYSSARIELENQGDVESRIWYHIDYELYDEVPSELEKTGLLHARWHREYPTLVHPPEGAEEELFEEWKNLSGEDNYVILDIKGDGQFAGYFLTVVNKDRSWWGEGDDMVFIDGEEFPPSIHGTGTEEIFGGGASPHDEYSGPYTGFHCIENRAGYEWWGTTGMYRFYINDPLRFRKSIKVTLEHGHANNLENDYCNVAFWYQYEPHKELPDLPPLEKRRINFEW